MLYAIIENGGKQYKAVEGEYIEIDLLPEEVGKKKAFNKVLMLVNGDTIQVGSPYLQGVTVDSTIVDHFKGTKITVFKYRPKQRYRVKSGHRQNYTKVIVDSIAFSGKAKLASAEEKPVEEKEVKKSKTRSKAAAKKPQTKKKISESTTAAKPAKKAEGAPSTRKSVKVLNLGFRTTNALSDAGINTVGQLMKKLESGDDTMLKISGIGEKSLADIKKKIKKLGYK